MMRQRNFLKPKEDLYSHITRVLNPALVVLCGYVAFYGYLLPKVEFTELPSRYHLAILLGAFFTLLNFQYGGAHRSWQEHSYLREARIVFLSWCSVVVLLVTLSFLTKTSEDFSRAWILLWWSFTGVFLVLVRFVLRYFLYKLRSEHHKRAVVIVGAGPLGRKLLTAIQSTPWQGLEVKAFFDEKPELHGSFVEEVPVVGSRDKILSYLDEKGPVDQIWITTSFDQSGDTSQLINQIAQRGSIEIRLIPDMSNFRVVNFSISEAMGFPFFNLTESPMHGINQVAKEAEDKLVACLSLLVLSPFLALIALGVKLSSPGPVFYRQKRVSWNGSTFWMLKFRSMPVGSEKKTGARWATKEDNRATAFGGFLRRTSLDELPQLFNVLKGDMSIVGPRPERPVFIEQFKHEIPDYMQRHLVKAGITGWAQVNGWRGNTDLATRIEYDIYYIENWSVMFDLKIMIKTIFKGMVDKNAY